MNIKTRSEELDDFSNNENNDFDIKKVIGQILSYWYLFAIGIVVCFSLAFFYARYATPSYKINGKITIDDQSNQGLGGKASSSGSFDFSDILDISSNAYNEIDILTTRSLMTKVVNALQLNVTIYRKGNLKYEELYDEAPFNIQYISDKDSVKDVAFTVIFNKNRINITSEEYGEINAKFGAVLTFNNFKLIFTKKPNRFIDDQKYRVTVTSIDKKVDQLSKIFDVQLTDKKSSTLALSFEYPNPKKGEVILSTLMNLYMASNRQNKIEIADSTIAFIDNRLKIVSSELSGVESNFEKFKQKNQLADVDAQSKALVSSVSDYQYKLNDAETQIAVANDISKYINDPSNKRIIPSSFSVQDPVFSGAIEKYNELLINRDKLTLSYKDSNPILQNFDSQIENARIALVKSFESYKRSLNLILNQVKSKNSSLSSQVESVPGKERIFLDYSREQDLKQQLYLFLLQKKEQTAISRTSTTSSARIIDPAKSDFAPYKPQAAIIYAVGFLLGLIIPFSYLYIKNLLQIRISSKTDITNATSVPILGEIGHNASEISLVVAGNSRAVIAEQFRALRTNLQFVLKQGTANIIMVTSSMSGEGKSFIAVNLASVLSLTGKRVILLEFDLRKPKLSENLGVDHNINGFTNYVMSESREIEPYIKPLFFSENCFLMSSGPIPPNPTELLMSPKFDNLMLYLKKNFDYVIIDSAPIGLVSDAQVIEQHVDLSIYVLRQNYTYKSQINIINDLKNQQKFKNLYIITNDISTKQGGYYGYGHGYGYGYGYGETS
jgi:tyrosine-protein kinase Etk/Wzc